MPEAAASNIALIGFMGSGKTTVGHLLSQRLEFRFVDTDTLVADAAGCSVPELFARDGETAFRDREAHAVAQACAGTGQIISTGGGGILRDTNREWLRQSSFVVWLTARPDVVADRVSGSAADGGRPVLATTDAEPLAVRILRLLGERGPLYQQTAHAIVDTSDRTPDSVAAEIVRKWQKAGGQIK